MIYSIKLSQLAGFFGRILTINNTHTFCRKKPMTSQKFATEVLVQKKTKIPDVKDTFPL